MSIIIPANSAAAGGGFNVANSLMFNRADSAYLVHTNSGTGSYQKSTFSAWVKRSSLGTIQTMWNNQVQAGVNQVRIEFDAADKIYLYGEEAGGYALRALTTSVYRDTSAWYHVLVIIDTPQSTAADRIKLYVNGVQVTLTFSTTPAQNANLRMNYDNTPVSVGSTQASNYLDGYMAEVYWIDGTVYATSDFGEFDEDSGIWKPIDASGLTFGTNGFYLDFEDSSALGNDAVGSNNFTANNLAATDQGTDTCTNNFSTLNLLATSSYATLSQGNNTVSGNTTANSAETFSTFSTGNNGKWYYEIKCTTRNDVGNPTIGFIHTARGFRLQNGEPGLGGATSGSLDIRVQPDGKLFENGAASGSAVISTYTDGDILGFAIDSDNGAFYVSKNGVWQTSGNPESGASRTGAIKTWSPTDSKVTEGQSVCIGVYNTAVADANFGSPHFAISSGNADADGFGNFEYAVPSGYFALCTKNLAEYG